MKSKVIDLFCGIGGLTHGLVQEGFNVVAGIDNDVSCRYGYESNNDARFIHTDIMDVSADFINRLFGKNYSGTRILVGCAPCQPFSILNSASVKRQQFNLLMQFGRLVRAVRPTIVLMENVAGLAKMEKHPDFKYFLDQLHQDYHVHYEIVDFSEYGVPQRRKRLVLFGSTQSEIRLIAPTHKLKKVTVRDALSDVESIEAGECSVTDPLHIASKLSPLNLLRIQSTKHDGGNSKSWDENLLAECHRKKSGQTYRCSVYARMHWDQPGPTITTQFNHFGTGRFGHPEQNRAISLREAALLQTFPQDYEFTKPGEPISIKKVAKFIGNAVPVKFGKVVGKSINNHLKHNDTT